MAGGSVGWGDGRSTRGGQTRVQAQYFEDWSASARQDGKRRGEGSGASNMLEQRGVQMEDSPVPVAPPPAACYGGLAPSDQLQASLKPSLDFDLLEGVGG